MIKVLVVDDEPLEGEAIRFLLAKERPAVESVHQAYSSRAAIEMAQRIKPQIAFIDIMMPSLDGNATIKLLKQSVTGIKIVILSAYDEIDYILKAIRIGANEYILKPARPQEILRLFDNLLHENVASVADADRLYDPNKLWEEITLNSALLDSDIVMKQLPDNNLAEQICSGDHQAAYELLYKLFSEINTSANGNIELIRIRSIKLAIYIIQSIIKENGDSNKELLTLLYRSFLNYIMSAQTINTIENSLKDLINNCLVFLKRDPDDTMHELIVKAKEFIQENLNKDITLENVAQHVHLSPFYFSRLFKVKTGSNYIDFLIDLRLEKAKLLLLSTNDTIASIAKNVGYSEINSFSRLFKSRLGIKPSEYRLRKIISTTA